MSNEPFAFPQAATVSLDATDTTDNVALSTVRGHQLRVHNYGSDAVYITYGYDNTVEAELTSSMPIPAGDIEVFTIPQESAIYVAGICNTGESTTVYFTRGNGF
jgi:hypothetical protein